MVTVNIDQLDPLYCGMHDSEYKWSGEFTEKKCNDKNCEHCKTRPGKITDKHCNYCALKEGCISWNARQLKKEDTSKP